MSEIFEHCDDLNTFPL